MLWPHLQLLNTVTICKRQTTFSSTQTTSATRQESRKPLRMRVSDYGPNSIIHAAMAAPSSSSSVCICTCHNQSTSTTTTGASCSSPVNRSKRRSWTVSSSISSIRTPLCQQSRSTPRIFGSPLLLWTRLIPIPTVLRVIMWRVTLRMIGHNPRKSCLAKVTTRSAPSRHAERNCLGRRTHRTGSLIRATCRSSALKCISKPTWMFSMVLAVFWITLPAPNSWAQCRQCVWMPWACWLFQLQA